MTGSDAWRIKLGKTEKAHWGNRALYTGKLTNYDSPDDGWVFFRFEGYQALRHDTGSAVGAGGVKLEWKCTASGSDIFDWDLVPDWALSHVPQAVSSKGAARASPDLLFDGQSTPCFVTHYSGVNYLRIDLGNVYNITRLRWQAGGDTNANSHLRVSFATHIAENEGRSGVLMSNATVSIVRHTTRTFDVKGIPARYVIFDAQRYARFQVCELSIAGVPVTVTNPPPVPPVVPEPGPLPGHSAFTKFSSRSLDDLYGEGYHLLHISVHDASQMTHYQYDNEEYYGAKKARVPGPFRSNLVPCPLSGTVYFSSDLPTPRTLRFTDQRHGLTRVRFPCGCRLSRTGRTNTRRTGTAGLAEAGMQTKTLLAGLSWISAPKRALTWFACTRLSTRCRATRGPETTPSSLATPAS